MEKSEKFEKSLESLASIGSTYLAELEAQEGGPQINLKSLPTLNDKIYGLNRKRLYVIGGRTSQGKTTLAMQMAMDLADQGLNTYFLSFEMDEREVYLRMLSNLCEIDANHLRYHVSQHKGKVEAVIKYLEPFPLLLTYNVGITMDELKRLIEDLAESDNKPDVVIVDYIQAIKKIDLDKLTTMNNYIVDFRTLCVEHNFVGIMVSQINRAAMDEKEKRPNLWQLKGSGVIEEHSDVVMLCHWDYFYTNDLSKRKDYKIVVAKNRQGNTGSIDINYIPEFYKFKDEKFVPDAKTLRAMEMFNAKIVKAEKTQEEVREAGAHQEA